MKALFVLAMVLLVGGVVSYGNRWYEWNYYAAQPGFVPSNFSVPKPATGWLRNKVPTPATTQYDKIHPTRGDFIWMRNHNMYYYWNATNVKMYCGPKGYQYNKTICIRDLSYWKQLGYPQQFCNPWVQGLLTQRNITILTSIGYCSDNNRAYGQYPCCFQNINYNSNTNLFMDVEDFQQLGDYRGLINLEPW